MKFMSVTTWENGRLKKNHRRKKPSKYLWVSTKDYLSITFSYLLVMDMKLTNVTCMYNVLYMYYLCTWQQSSLNFKPTNRSMLNIEKKISIYKSSLFLRAEYVTIKRIMDSKCKNLICFVDFSKHHKNHYFGLSKLHMRALKNISTPYWIFPHSTIFINISK